MNAPAVQYARTSDGASIAYAVAGQGRPIIRAAVPGVTQVQRDWQIYARILQGLSREFQISWYDSRGAGMSDRNARDWSMDAMQKDLDAVVAANGFSQFVLMTWSTWSPIGLTYAARNPERVSHLVVIDGTADSGARTPEMEELERSTRPLLESNWELYTEMLGKVLINYEDAEYIKAWVEHQRTCVDQATYIEISDAVRNWNAKELLGQIKVPTLVIHNANYRLLPASFGQEIAASIPGARFQSIDEPLEAMWANLPQLVRRFVEGEANAVTTSGAAVVRTVLFTDIVGHTEMMQRLGDEAGRNVLREHERITREVLKANGGTEVKTMGDGFMASFGSVTKAVECAVALQRAFAKREGEPLAVRVGLNAGEPIEEDGDLFGATVILASRIAAKAEGGEILVADTVRGLCSGKGLLFADRGEFVAKGFEEPVRVYEVSWRG